MRTLSKTLNDDLASTTETHQYNRNTIIKRTRPTGSFAHNSPLKSSASRLNATVNAIVLSITDVSMTGHEVRPMNHLQCTTYAQRSNE